jgi:1-acyl-sn-glycerol-3-phosphate acyltransferase
MALLRRALTLPLDLVVTLLLWIYFTVGYLVFFLPLHVAVWLFARSRAASFQWVNQTFFRVFFRLVRLVAPALRLRVSPAVSSIRSSVIVSNHVSYLDPILLMAFLERAVSVVKATFFGVPFMAWALRNAGHLPAGPAQDGELGLLLMQRLEELRGHLEAGGCLFVFPEGTRGRPGALGAFHKGVFRIAMRCRAPIDLVLLRGTDSLFARGRFLFNISSPARIEVEWLGRLTPDYDAPDFTLSALVEEARRVFLARLEDGGAGRAAEPPP